MLFLWSSSISWRSLWRLKSWPHEGVYVNRWQLYRRRWTDGSEKESRMALQHGRQQWLSQMAPWWPQWPDGASCRMGDSNDCPRWLPGDRSGLMEHHATQRQKMEAAEPKYNGHCLWWNYPVAMDECESRVKRLILLSHHFYLLSLFVEFVS